MLLDSITGPADLQGRSYDELDDLCDQIREHVVDAVARRGGHLGSNLGAVELTVALHRVFRSPHDAILWDRANYPLISYDPNVEPVVNRPNNAFRCPSAVMEEDYAVADTPLCTWKELRRMQER